MGGGDGEGGLAAVSIALVSRAGAMEREGQRGEGGRVDLVQ